MVRGAIDSCLDVSKEVPERCLKLSICIVRVLSQLTKGH